jgi:hypothetical protein
MPVPRPHHHLTVRSATSATLRRTVAAALGGALVFGFTSVAHAYRPFDGTDADVAETGEFELECGSAYTAIKGTFTQLTAPWLVLNLGIYHRFELVLETNNVLAQRPAGGVLDQLQETHAFVKAVLRKGVIQDQTGPSIAVEAGPWLPNPNGEIGVGGSADFIVSIKIQRLILHLNLMGAYQLDHHVQGFASLIGEGPHALAVRPVFELVAQHTLDGPTLYSGLAGGIWAATKDLDVDLGLRGASTDQVPSAQLRLGFTLRVPVWHPKD